MAVGVEAHRAALEEYTRERAPLEWARTQNSLGVALSDLSWLEGNIERLEEAVAAYESALKERTRKRRPLEWARTQNNLGGALWILGQSRGDTKRQEEAVEAHHAAVEEFTREHVPGFWAFTQNNLGDALRILGELEVGTMRLEEAAAAFRAALEEYSPQPNRVESARRIQDELDGVLKRLNDRQAKRGTPPSLRLGFLREGLRQRPSRRGAGPPRQGLE